VTDLAIAVMVRAALLARDAGAPDGCPLVVRRRGITVTAATADTPAHAVARHVVEWDGATARGLVIADVVVVAP
jgi:hypothetical protein